LIWWYAHAFLNTHTHTQLLSLCLCLSLFISFSLSLSLSLKTYGMSNMPASWDNPMHTHWERERWKEKYSVSPFPLSLSFFYLSHSFSLLRYVHIRLCVVSIVRRRHLSSDVVSHLTKGLLPLSSLLFMCYAFKYVCLVVTRLPLWSEVCAIVR
jgi:hypothetical protein